MKSDIGKSKFQQIRPALIRKYFILKIISKRIRIYPITKNQLYKIIMENNPILLILGIKSQIKSQKCEKWNKLIKTYAYLGCEMHMQTHLKISKMTKIFLKTFKMLKSPLLKKISKATKMPSIHLIWLKFT